MSSISHFKKKMSSSQNDPANEKKKKKNYDKKMGLIKPVSPYVYLSGAQVSCRRI